MEKTIYDEIKDTLNNYPEEEKLDYAISIMTETMLWAAEDTKSALGMLYFVKESYLELAEELVEEERFARHALALEHERWNKFNR